jgi:hypothetical protein
LLPLVPECEIRPLDFAKSIIESIVNYFNGKTRNGLQIPITEALIHTDGVEALAKSIDDMAKIYIDNFDDDLYLWQLRFLKKIAQRYYDKNNIDLYFFMFSLSNYTQIPELNSACKKVMTQIDDCVKRNGVLGESVKNSNGVSIYFPFLKLEGAYYSLYKKLNFNIKYSNWCKMLETYHNY